MLSNQLLQQLDNHRLHFFGIQELKEIENQLIDLISIDEDNLTFLNTSTEINNLYNQIKLNQHKLETVRTEIYNRYKLMMV